jgi:hypothetical protein
MQRRSEDLTATSQVVKQYHCIVNCTMNVDDLIATNFCKFKTHFSVHSTNRLTDILPQVTDFHKTLYKQLTGHSFKGNGVSAIN